jgi:hypothetical protein
MLGPHVQKKKKKGKNTTGTPCIELLAEGRVRITFHEHHTFPSPASLPLLDRQVQ